MCLLRSECVLTLSTKMSVWATSFSLASGAIKLDANHFRMFMWCYLCHCPRYSTTTSTTPENTRREAGVKSLPILSALKSWFRRVFYSVFALYVWAALQCTVSPAATPAQSVSDRSVHSEPLIQFYSFLAALPVTLFLITLFLLPFLFYRPYRIEPWRRTEREGNAIGCAFDRIFFYLLQRKTFFCF